jgi:hypothetical protein
VETTTDQGDAVLPRRWGWGNGDELVVDLRRVRDRLWFDEDLGV